MNINDIPNEAISAFADFLDNEFANDVILEQIKQAYHGGGRTHKIIRCAVESILKERPDKSDIIENMFKELDKRVLELENKQNLMEKQPIINNFNAPVGNVQQGEISGSVTVNMPASIQTLLEDRIKPVLESQNPSEETLFPLLKELFQQLKDELAQEFNNKSAPTSNTQIVPKPNEVSEIIHELAMEQVDLQGQIQDINEVLSEAIVLLNQNQKPVGFSQKLTKWADGVNSNVVANLIASPIYETIKLVAGI